MLQAHAPDAFENARSHPGLEPQMARAAGTVLAGNHLPLAASTQNEQDAVEDGPVGHPRPPVGSRRLVGRQDGFDQFPQVIRNLAESIPLFRFLAHRIVLHDVTMCVSALTDTSREGF